MKTTIFTHIARNVSDPTNYVCECLYWATIGLSYQRLQTWSLRSCKNISTQQFKISLTSDIPILKIIEDAKKGHKIQNTTFDCLYKWFVQRGFWNEKYDMFNDIINTDNNDDNNMLSEQLEIKEEQNTNLQEQNTKLQEENNELKKQLEELKKLLNTKYLARYCLLGKLLQKIIIYINDGNYLSFTNNENKSFRHFWKNLKFQSLKFQSSCIFLVKLFNCCQS